MRLCNDTDPSQKFSYDKDSRQVHVPSAAFRGSELHSAKAQCFHIRPFPDVLLLDVNACNSNGTLKINEPGGTVTVQRGFWVDGQYDAPPNGLMLTANLSIKPYCASENQQSAQAYYRGGFIETVCWIGAVVVMFGLGPLLFPTYRSDGDNDEQAALQATQDSVARCGFREAEGCFAKFITGLLGLIAHAFAVFVASEWSRPLAKWFVLKLLMPLLVIYAAFWYSSSCLNAQGETQQLAFSAVMIVFGGVCVYTGGRNALEYVRRLARIPAGVAINSLMGNRGFKRTLNELEESEKKQLWPVLFPIPMVLFGFVILPTVNIIVNLVKSVTCTTLQCQLQSAPIGWFAMRQCHVPDRLQQNLLACRCTGREPMTYAVVAAFASLCSCVAGRRLHLREATAFEAIFNQLMICYTVSLGVIGGILWFWCTWYDETQESLFSVALFTVATDGAMNEASPRFSCPAVSINKALVKTKAPWHVAAIQNVWSLIIAIFSKK